MRRSGQEGVVLAVFAVGLTALLLMVGLALDAGFLYMSRAALAKGTDAAALMGVRALGQGQTVARQVAESTFAINYAGSGLPLRQVSSPTVRVTFSIGADGMTRLRVDSTVQYYTFLIGLLPGWDRLSVRAEAEGARARLIMALVLDRSGSMLGNGGALALPGAVTTFVGFFDDANDKASLASYADHATVDLTMRHTFKTLVSSITRVLRFGGWTYGHGGIDAGRAQINSTPLPPGENVMKALVFFTDGHANAFLERSFRCRNGNNGRRDVILVPGDDNDDFRDPGDGEAVTCNHGQARNFFSEKYARSIARSSASVTEEGLYHAEQSAQAARQDGTYVYAIGLGSDIDRNSLRRIANDPSASGFNPAQPEGLAVFAPTAAELDDVFRQIAARILLRLTL